MKGRKPNIIFVLTDDQGAWAMHCAGNDDVITPNLDDLAESGMRFENFFCASPVCSPARASILTGMMPSQHGVHDWIFGGSLDKEVLVEQLGEEASRKYWHEHKPIQYLEGMTTYTDILARNGYTCALSGKWHLGDSMTPQHGFSKWFTIGRGGCPYYEPDIVEDGKIHIDDRYITDTFTDKALEYIDELDASGQPYYLSIHYTAPHAPFNLHPQEFVDLYHDCRFTATPDLPIHPNQNPTMPRGEGEERKSLLRGYYASISAMDHNLGRIINHVKEKGQWDNTIFIFTSDNGMNMGHHGIWGKGNGTFPLNMYDTSVKVPFIMRVPGVTPEGAVSQTMHSHYDIIHTLVDLLGLTAELSDELPGSSFAKDLYGENCEEDGHVFVCDEYGATRMVRTREWKYVRRYPYGEDELYHLVTDPEEYNNLEADPAYKDIRQELWKTLENWFSRYVRPEVDGVRERVMGLGQLDRAGIYAEGKKNYKEFRDI